MNYRTKITRQKHFGGEKQFKSQSKKPPKPLWRGETSTDNTRFSAKPILEGRSGQLQTRELEPKYQIRTPNQLINVFVLLNSANRFFLVSNTFSMVFSRSKRYFGVLTLNAP
ncbi:Hypothetical protein Tcol_2912 [Trichococcus collinsii]|uniref:Uncharacterized protein n=1 Tax=Trichococcus collinsii TaxID=157076 RepID=A0AB37ZY48_9LACT|nr:Hypothetical protein Tcol_2912 [Trichococcus collinsii]SEA14886.1 hypothetical protein SAMN04488525_10287 [Trichococcus collinsii]